MTFVTRRKPYCVLISNCPACQTPRVCVCVCLEFDVARIAGDNYRFVKDSITTSITHGRSQIKVETDRWRSVLPLPCVSHRDIAFTYFTYIHTYAYIHTQLCMD
jgi:hypothetical protein